MEAHYKTADDVRVTIGLEDSNGEIINDNINDIIKSGSVGAILQMGGPASTNLTVQNALDMLNDLAAGFAEVMNEIQTRGWIEQPDGTFIPDPDADSYAMCLGKDSEGKTILASPKEKMFVTSDGMAAFTAGNITVNSNLRNNISGISAAIVTATSTDLTNTVEIDGQTGKQYTLVNEADRLLVGNGKAMAAVLDTRNGTNNLRLNNLSPEDFLMTGISKIGVQSESISNQEASQSAKCDSIETQLQNETGVDLNEELMDMVKYQNAYQASARVFNTCCDILNVILSLGA